MFGRCKWSAARRLASRLACAALPLAVLLGAFEARAEEDKKLVRLWKAKCSSCHGPDGKAQTKQGREMEISDMSSPEWQQKFTDQKIIETIETGVNREKNGKKQEMKAWKPELAPEQISQLVAYVRTFAAK